RVVHVSGAGGPGIEDLGSRAEPSRPPHDRSGELERRRAEKAGEWMWPEVSETLMDALRHDEQVAALAARLEAAVTAGELPPAAAARQILDAFQRPDR